MIVHVRQRRKRGRGLINKAINKLPFELHLPGYQYCGPGTKLAKRLARGDPGINPLDVACKEHDIAYSQNREDVGARNAADRVLADKAWSRVKSSDASIGERTAAYAVTNAMKLKSKFGMGLKKRSKVSAGRKKKKCLKRKLKPKTGMGYKKKRSLKKKSKSGGGLKKKKRTSLSSVVKAASFGKSTPSKCAKSVIRSALRKAQSAVKKSGGRGNIIVPRVLPVPAKVGGVLPFLIPLFAGLSATGALAGGAAGIVKAVNATKAAKEELYENKRHNKTMEAIALGKGLYLKPYKQGLGLHLKPYIRGGGLKKKDRSKITSKSSHRRRHIEICKTFKNSLLSGSVYAKCATS